MEDISYLQRRERQERAAAKRSSHMAARAAHQELAQHYAALIAATSPRPFSATELRAA